MTWYPLELSYGKNTPGFNMTWVSLSLASGAVGLFEKLPPITIPGPSGIRSGCFYTSYWEDGI